MTNRKGETVAAAEPVIQANRLCIDYQIDKTWLNAIRDVTLRIDSLQIHGLVGESGSGKSTLGLALMRYLDANARIRDGQILFEGSDLVQQSGEDMRAIWGSRMSLVPQNPLDSLNPSLTIGAQMAELTRQHMGFSLPQALDHATTMLHSVRIADPDAILRRYPHQLSGGMQQRVMIAMALSTRPRLLVLDEPTTALDVTTQAVILDLFRDLIREEQAAALYVSHDLGTVAQLCDYVTVLYAGEVMESAPVEALYRRPLHPYTAGLLASLPSAAEGQESRLSTIEGVAPSLSERPPACVFAARCPVAVEQCHAEKPPLENTPDGRLVRCWRWQEIAAGALVPRSRPQGKTTSAPPREGYALQATGLDKRFGKRTFFERLTGKAPDSVHAVDTVSVQIKARSTLGLVGESGSGKTTLARCIAGLETADSGELQLCDIPLTRQLNRRSKAALRNLQMVFQNPHDALNPYHTVGETLERTLAVLQPEDERLTRPERRARALHLLDAVGLTAEYAARYPAQLSGGEKQRVAIARAFAANPALVIADEPTSSLDVSVQAVILNLLKDLRAQEGASYLLISHDLEIISYLADWIMVMYLGEIVEEGSNAQVYSAPSHPYTEALLSAAPLPDPGATRGRIRLDGEVPSPRNKPGGCPFHTRCPRKIGAICETDDPPLRAAGEGHRIRCHIPVEELTLLQTQLAEGS
ncbi:MAG: ABC transporter ATP-binding protein [Anaerolineae bacterium]|nr:ABC transporter ATP-binding protein [Anaerolineae bacterium]